MTTPDNHVVTPDTTDDLGRPVYVRPSGAGFFIVIEGKTGSSGAAPGLHFSVDDGTPDLQIEASHDLGNGSPAVCDAAGPPPAPTPGGVPGINPPSFDPLVSRIVDALNDFGCRFVDNTDSPCTLNSREIFAFVKSDTTKQACSAGVLGSELRFPHGDTVLTVQWRDASVTGNIGLPKQLVVRVP